MTVRNTLAYKKDQLHKLRQRKEEKRQLNGIWNTVLAFLIGANAAVLRMRNNNIII